MPTPTPTAHDWADHLDFVQAHAVLAEQWLADIAYASPKADPVRALHADLCAWLTRLHAYHHGPAPPFLLLPSLPILPTNHPPERTSPMLDLPTLLLTLAAATLGGLIGGLVAYRAARLYYTHLLTAVVRTRLRSHTLNPRTVWTRRPDHTPDS